MRFPVVVGYARVSSKKQTEYSQGHVSLEVQGREINQWVRKEGSRLDSLVKEVRSARNSDAQKGLHRVIRRAIEIKADAVVVYSIDRFTRDLRGGLNIIHRLKRNGIQLFSITENTTYSGTNGTNLINLTLAFAQHQSNVTSDRVKGTVDYLRGIGQKFGRAPYGKEAIRRPTGATVEKDGVEVPVTIRVFVQKDDEASVIAQIMQLSRRETAGEIAEALNARGETRRGLPWTKASVQRIIWKEMSAMRMNPLRRSLPRV